MSAHYHLVLRCIYNIGKRSSFLVGLEGKGPKTVFLVQRHCFRLVLLELLSAIHTKLKRILITPFLKSEMSMAVSAKLLKARLG